MSLTFSDGRAIDEGSVDPRLDWDDEMIERWLPGPAGAAVDAVTRSWQLRELPAPSQAELDALEHFGPDGYAAIHQPSSAEGNSRTWGALLSDLAQELTDGLFLNFLIGTLLDFPAKVNTITIAIHC